MAPCPNPPGLEEFLAAWTNDPGGVKEVFLKLHRRLAGLEGVELSFKARPGVSYSLRAARQGQKARPLFALIDVIDDDPDSRWLSVCFYEDLIDDPEGRGNLVPAGILGEDGHCFDLEEPDRASLAYLAARIDQAHRAARNG